MRPVATATLAQAHSEISQNPKLIPEQTNQSQRTSATPRQPSNTITVSFAINKQFLDVYNFCWEYYWVLTCYRTLKLSVMERKFFTTSLFSFRNTIKNFKYSHKSKKVLYRFYFSFRNQSPLQNKQFDNASKCKIIL